jgi:sugar-specific transcriptional regulator TrmB
MIYEELLTKAGFEPKEIKVYLAALELGSAPAAVIAKTAGVVRSTSYGILESLVQKGLASKSERSGVLWFNVDNPGLLKNYIESQKNNLDEVSKEITKFLPDLKKLQKAYGFKTEVEFYEGAKGVVAAMESTIPDIKKMAKENIPILINGQTAKMVEFWPTFPEFAAWRAKTGVKIKMFVSETRNDFIDPRMQTIRQKHYETKQVPEKYLYSAGTNILEDKMILFDFDQLVTVVIKSKPLVDMVRMMFDFMWANVK